jgi:ribulose-5-phosphate 4-epimerase/fuculose-1-phosphate aldolase
MGGGQPRLYDEHVSNVPDRLKRREEPVTDSAVADVLHQLVIANRLLAREDVIDDFGHVSVRHPENPQRYFLSRSRSPEIVVREDIIEFTLEGEPIELNGRPMYRERALHGAVYMARPDVNAVTHHHARSVLPFSLTGKKLRPAFHMASVIGHEVPVWDSRPEFGDTNMLIETIPQGQSMARAMGQERCVLLRGHGATCSGTSLREVVFVSIYLKENAELVLNTLPLGEPDYLSAGEIDQTRAMLLSDMPQTRAWDYRAARAGFRGL